MKTAGQVGYEAMRLRIKRLNHNCPECAGCGLTHEESCPYLTFGWDEESQTLRDDWNEVGEAIAAFAVSQYEEEHRWDDVSK